MGPETGGTGAKEPAMWAVGEPCNGYAKILRSDDGGRTWLRQGSVQTLPTAMLAGVAAADRGRLWAVGKRIHAEPAGVILRSEDGGDTWTEWRDPATEGEILKDEFGAVVCADAKTVWAVGYHGKIIKSTDGGDSWEVQTSGTDAHLQGLWALDEKHVWATGSADEDTTGVILYSSNGGDPWESQGESVIKAGVLGVCAVDPDAAWAVGSKWTVYSRTKDQPNWQAMQPGPDLFDMNGIAALDSKRVWYVADNDTLGVWTGSEWRSRTIEPTGYYLLRIRALPDGRLLIGGRSYTGQEGGVIHVVPESGETISHQDPVGIYDVAYAL